MRVRVDLDVHPTRAEIVAAHLWALGAVGVWQRPDALTAWFDAVPGGLRDAGSVGHPLGGTGDWPRELAPELLRWSDDQDWRRDWQEEWKATIVPVRAGRIVVVPSWLAGTHAAAPDDLTLVLDPGRAFGSGHHATTTLCLELLDDLDLRGVTVADMGCGTGILAIAAAARGAQVTAVDIDPDAVEVTRDNARRNNVEVACLVGSVEALATAPSVVVANLVTDTVVALATQLVATARHTLVVSGIAVERRDRALDALVAAGARLEEVRERDGWLAARLTTTHDATAPHDRRPTS